MQRAGAVSTAAGFADERLQHGVLTAYVRRQPARLAAWAMIVFPAGGQQAARRNAASSMKRDEGRARSRDEADVAMEHAIRQAAELH